MANFLNVQSDFLDQLIELIEHQMSDENFGVAELAEEAGMSRSNLLRKVQKLTGFSVSILIRKVRLNRAKALLKDDRLNVSEVSYQVGFNSVSYFVKCYREEYGHPPGEESRQIQEQITAEVSEGHDRPAFLRYLLPFAVLITLILVIAWLARSEKQVSDDLEKSIAVLPFKNDSSDSSNVYIINGLMESILTNLQKIEGLRVVSRTSVEPYRYSNKSISQISRELGVNYFIEGSGQKLGDQILLSIQLIQAPSDENLWSQQYHRQSVNIFDLQTNVAKDIAQEVRVIITPEEARRIEKVPTTDLQAYDLYLRGIELTNERTAASLEEAVIYFKEAIREDPDFALANAYVAICYYYLDIFLAEKHYTEQINQYADRALMLDAELPQTLIAKGLYYMQTAQYEQAAQYFEKVLDFNPNSAEAYNFLSDIYANYLFDTEKYLEYALKVLKLEITRVDSTTVSYNYLHLGNALAQSGFLEEAETYIQMSLDFDENNFFSEYLLAYVRLGQHRDFERTKDRMLEIYAKDTTRADIVQEVAKLYYALEDYENAALYYDRFLNLKETFGLDLFRGEAVKIGFVYAQTGRSQELVDAQYAAYRDYIENDESVYRSLSQAAYHAVNGEVEEGIEALRRFSNLDNYQFWFVLFLEDDPIIRLLNEHPDYNGIIQRINDNLWKRHRALEGRLKDAGVL